MKKIVCDKCKNEIIDTSEFYTLEILLKESVIEQWEICKDCQEKIIGEMEEAGGDGA